MELLVCTLCKTLLVNECVISRLIMHGILAGKYVDVFCLYYYEVYAKKGVLLL